MAHPSRWYGVSGGGTDPAVRDGAGQEVRGKAAADVLGRAGVRAAVEVDSTVGQAEVSPVDLLRDRLTPLRRRTIEGAAAGAGVSRSDA